MMTLEGVQSLLSTFSSIAVSLGAIIALLATVFKPIRNVVLRVFNTLWERKDKNKEILDKIDCVEVYLSQKVDDLKEDLTQKIKDVSDRNDEDEKDRIRWEILNFANSCRDERKHTKDEYQHIVELNTKYHKLLEKTGDENGVFEAEYDYIKELYAERLRKNDFL